jgi:hypothetical protein
VCHCQSQTTAQSGFIQELRGTASILLRGLHASPGGQAELRKTSQGMIMSRLIFREFRAYLLAVPLVAWMAVGCGSSISGPGPAGTGGGSSGLGAGGCSVGTSGSPGTVCIKWPQESTSSMSASTGGGAGGAGGSGGTVGAGGMAACPSTSDARPFVAAMEPNFMAILSEVLPRENGTCCYSIVHQFCY